MYPITVRDVSPFDAIGYKFQLIQAGLVMDDDFSWAYVPSTWDNFTGETHGKYVVFQFREESLATFYQLKWT